MRRIVKSALKFYLCLFNWPMKSGSSNIMRRVSVTIFKPQKLIEIYSFFTVFPSRSGLGLQSWLLPA